MKDLIVLAEQGTDAVRDVSGLVPDGGGWTDLIWPAALSLMAVAVCVWIIRERMKKSSEYGV